MRFSGTQGSPRLFDLSKAMLGSQDSACDEIVRTKFIFLEIPK
jgi:hypothetical protein